VYSVTYTCDQRSNNTDFILTQEPNNGGAAPSATGLFGPNAEGSMLYGRVVGVIRRNWRQYAGSLQSSVPVPTQVRVQRCLWLTVVEYECYADYYAFARSHNATDAATVLLFCV
jgi:hypothetical protein